MQNALPQSHPLFFHAIEQAARPHEFGRQDTECEEDGEGSWAGGYYHYDAETEKGEANHDFEEPLGLLNCPNDH